MARTGTAAARIAALENELRQPSFQAADQAGKRYAYILLALLLEGQGKAAPAEGAWSALFTRPDLRAAAPIAAKQPGDKTGT